MQSKTITRSRKKLMKHFESTKKFNMKSLDTKSLIT